MPTPMPSAAHVRSALAARRGPADRGADPQDHEQERLGLVARNAGSERGHVPAGDMSGLVRDDADHLVGRLGLQDRAVIDEHVEAVDHEGVEVLGFHDAHRDVRAEPRRPEDRTRVVLEQVLGLGIADERDALRHGRRRGEAHRQAVEASNRGGAPAGGEPAAGAARSGRCLLGGDGRAATHVVLLHANDSLAAAALSSTLCCCVPATEALVQLGNSNRPNYKPLLPARASHYRVRDRPYASRPKRRIRAEPWRFQGSAANRRNRVGG